MRIINKPGGATITEITHGELSALRNLGYKDEVNLFISHILDSQGIVAKAKNNKRREEELKHTYIVNQDHNQEATPIGKLFLRESHPIEVNDNFTFEPEFYKHSDGRIELQAVSIVVRKAKKK